MRIVCAGAGPAGLFAARLAAVEARHSVAVVERKAAGTCDGWGVVFWDDLLDDLRSVDPETADRIAAAAYPWCGQVLDRDGDRVEIAARGYGIGRGTLCNILAEQAEAAGVEIAYGREVVDACDIGPADVVIASDGANSVLRSREPLFGTSVAAGRNPYVWLGTPQPFPAFLFAFVSTDAGPIWAHAYGYEHGMSTFIVECTAKTFRGLGLDVLDRCDGLHLLGELFAPHLHGAPLLSPRPNDTKLPWCVFRTITNDRWHVGHTVLAGDAAHTTHFSIGSGTRLALQDAISLSRALRDHCDVEDAFSAYEIERRDALLRPQRDAVHSAQWFEHVERYLDEPAQAFFILLRARRDPLLAHMSPHAYFQLYKAVDRVAVLRKVRERLGPRVREMYARLRS